MAISIHVPAWRWTAYTGVSSGSHDVPDPSRVDGITMSWSSPMCMCCMSCGCAGLLACAEARFAVTPQMENANAPMRTDEDTRADIHPCSPRLNGERLDVGGAGIRREAGLRAGFLDDLPRLMCAWRRSRAPEPG